MNKAERLAGQIDALSALRTEKEALRQDIAQCSQRITMASQELMQPLSHTSQNIFRLNHMLSRGMAIYQGVKIGSQIVRTALLLFRRKK